MLNNVDIGKKIALLRKQNGFTQDDLAEKLGITAQAISKWENGHTLPETALLPLLAKMLNSSIDSILMPCTIRNGEKLKLGKHEWRVLQVKDGGILVTSETTVGKAPFHDIDGPITWEKSNLRNYLNEYFYNTFSSDEKARIQHTQVTDRDNPWYGTKCGETTIDKIFLLSYDEVIEYFGDSGDMKNKKGWHYYMDELTPCDDNCHLKYGDCINDEYSEARKVKDIRGKDDWWWLRSPGGQGSHTAGSIGYHGELWLCGDDAYRVDGGIRPAMWLNHNKV